ncbi:hypothetical protein XACLE20_1790013 [Xanthomonas citri pv. citri]|nr:hypothetical protein XACLE20_1790013 [Xanthomonas citri pv. citri]CEH60915.1 hypothetical protein XACLE3_9030013 [Xanthomonas citri pv. citri]
MAGEGRQRHGRLGKEGWNQLTPLRKQDGRLQVNGSYIQGRFYVGLVLLAVSRRRGFIHISLYEVAWRDILGAS